MNGTGSTLEIYPFVPTSCYVEHLHLTAEKENNHHSKPWVKLVSIRRLNCNETERKQNGTFSYMSSLLSPPPLLLIPTSLGEGSHLLSSHPGRWHSHKWAQNPSLFNLSHFIFSQNEAKSQPQSLRAAIDLQTIWDNFLYIPGWCFSTNYLYTESGNLFLTKLKTQILQLSFFLPLTSIPLGLGWLSQCIWLPNWMGAQQEAVNFHTYFSVPLLQIFSMQKDWKVQFPHFNPNPLKVQVFSYFSQHNFMSLGRGSTLPYVVSRPQVLWPLPQ